MAARKSNKKTSTKSVKSTKRSARSKQQRHNHNLQFDTVVVGGGVAGLYCSWKLSQRTPVHRVGLFEGLDRFGGRIETVEFGPFFAEFGPMRFEKPGQQRLMELFDELGLETEDFAPYQAERPDFPVYDLMDDEKGPPPFDKRYTTLELMKLGIIRILKDTEWRSHGDPDNPRDPMHNVWLAELSESDYAAMRKEAKQGDEYLHNRGLWNALSDVLSHHALMKIRDLGTFYHLIPENPNAIEWIIFWLRGLNPRDKLVSVKGGSQKITDGLIDKLNECPDRVELYPKHKLTRIESLSAGGRALLEFAVKDGDPIQVQARHVVLALPTSPLKKLTNYFGPQTQKDLDAVFGFPLLKCFFLVDEPWWDEETKPQTRASLIPTREIHYKYDRETGQGLVMLYTDRPATEFWKPYVKGEVHDRAEIGKDRRLVKLFFRYLARELKIEARKHPVESLLAAAAGAETREDLRAKAIEALAPIAYSFFTGPGAEHFNFPPAQLAHAREIPVEQLAENLAQRVVKFGIRDWNREPYGAACHTWRPGAKSWEVLGRLKSFSLSEKQGDCKNIHICGEAYSDYNGFIEGALRTADDVLETIN